MDILDLGGRWHGRLLDGAVGGVHAVDLAAPAHLIGRHLLVCALVVAVVWQVGEELLLKRDG
jgi:hypothetical protein